MKLFKITRSFLLAVVASLLVFISAGTTMAESQIKSETLATHLVPGPVEYKVLLPDGYEAAKGPLPLLIMLHGGGGSSDMLTDMQPLLERAWQEKKLPPMVVATPSAARSFYMDYKDGSEKWETFLLTEWLPHLRQTLNISQGREGTAITGISMGGLGTLRMSLKNPDMFIAAMALEPGIEAALAYKDLQDRDTFYRSGMYEEKFGSPVDTDYWAANNPATIATNNADKIRTSRIALYLEVGDKDMFYLHFGTEFLHRTFFDQKISHEYRLVKGANHIGASIQPRMLDALSFLGRTLNPPEPDKVPLVVRTMIAAQKKRHGIKDDDR